MACQGHFKASLWAWLGVLSEKGVRLGEWQWRVGSLVMVCYGRVRGMSWAFLGLVRGVLRVCLKVCQGMMFSVSILGSGRVLGVYSMLWLQFSLLFYERFRLRLVGAQSCDLFDCGILQGFRVAIYLEVEFCRGLGLRFIWRWHFVFYTNYYYRYFKFYIYLFHHFKITHLVQSGSVQ